MILLEIKNLTKKFDGIKAVNNLSFQIKKNSIVSLIGPNGAGKTTVFNIINGFIKADRGEILFKGKSINNMLPYEISNLGIGRTFQITRLFNELILLDNLLVSTKQKTDKLLYALFKRNKTEEESSVQKCIELLKKIKLEEKIYSFPYQLSYGQKKLIEIARVLLLEPDLLLLDEPISGVAPGMILQIKEFILNLRKQGKTILLIEHNIKFVLEISDWVIVMNNGEKIAEGKPDEIKNNSKVIEAYLGDLKEGIYDA